MYTLRLLLLAGTNFSVFGFAAFWQVLNLAFVTKVVCCKSANEQSTIFSRYLI